MLIRDRLKFIVLALILIPPAGLALYMGLDASLDRADFVFVNQGEVSSLDPALATGIPEGRILMALFEGLTSLDPKTLEPLPACAESWDLSEDGKVYTFHLRKNLKWSNNQPLTSQDFFYSWKRLLDPKTASSYAYLLWDLAEDGILIPDEYTFTVRLKSPCPYFLVLTAFYPLFPVFAQSEHDNVNVVCNGPYIVKLRLLKDRIRLVRNPNYWDSG